MCVGITGDETTTATTTTKSVTATATTIAGNVIATPMPYQVDIVDDCDLFHLVISGDGCYDIAAAADIALDDFYAWNPDMDDTCANLYLGYYVCFGIEQ